MPHSALDAAIELVRSFQIGSRQMFESALHHQLSQATQCAAGNDYIDDCLHLVQQALDNLFSPDCEPALARANLIGAIEALRDELALAARAEPEFRAASAN